MSDIESLTPEERVELTRATMAIVDGWKLDGEQTLSVLGLTDKVRVRHLAKFRDDTAFPDEPDVMARVSHILHIAEALVTAYPRNAPMRKLWFGKPQRRFRGRTPKQLILEKGREGLSMVRAELDCTYMWDQTGSTRG
jgi:hypothetical protein